VMVLRYGSWELYHGNEGWYMNGRFLCHFSLQSGNVGAVYEYGMLCIVQGHGAVWDEVVGEEV